MKIEVGVGDIAAWEDEVVVVNLFEGVDRPGGATGAVDAGVGHQISAMIRTGDITGKFKETVVFPSFDRIPGNRVLVVGLGKREEFGLDQVREASAAAALKVREMGLKTFATIVHGAGIAGLDLREATEALVEGAVLGLYRYTEYKTEFDKRKIESFTIVTRDKEKAGTVRESVHAATVTASAANFARDLINAPSNDKPPRLFVERLKAAAKEAGAELTVYDEKQLEKMGFGALLGVAKGSVEPPRFVMLRHSGGGRGKPIALVGKGITFDSGGIALKPLENPGGGGGMWLMRSDMGGAAVVLSSVLAAARLKLPLNVVALAPMTENMPSGSAQKPGDIVRSFGGRTIEVINPDAEGRLVLADALGFAKTLKPQAVVDLATLTGAISIALGHRAAGLFSNDDALARRLERAADATAERVWRLPLWAEYEEQIKSDSADVKNTGGRAGGSITAAKFLETFADGMPWIHLDIAGTSWIEDGPDYPKRAYLPLGASGYGVRLLVRMLRDWNAA